MAKNRKFLLLLFFISAFLSASGFCFASELQYPPVFGLSLNDTSTFPEYARYFFSIGIFLSATLSAIVIIFGGIYYLVSFGRSQYTGEGKDWIKAGILGLFLILGAYLIVYTINPDLAIFRLNGLTPVIVANPIPEMLNPNTPRVYYSEIPIGVLTENTLARTMDCYDFDYNGDPISAPLEAEGSGTIAGPTFRDHDRADCIAKLAEAAEAKAKLIKNLSDKITSLMEQCRCENSDEEGKPICDQTCEKENPCDRNNDYSGKCETSEDSAKKAGDPCSGNCSKQSCKFSEETESNSCCPADSKDLIEHGPIKLNLSEECGGEQKEYKGLDEFRTQLSNISSIVERQVQANGKTITVIDEDKWKNLKLIEQLMYFKEKINDLKSKIKSDSDQLSNAKGELGRCLYAMSSIDFLKIYEQTRPEEKIILKNKTYSDATTGSVVDISKYCNGFSYGNSSCFNSCQSLCPGNPQKDQVCYKGCEQCNPDDSACLARQKTCMEKCYNQRECVKKDNFGNFEGCIAYCRGQCSNNCANKFSSCSTDITKCQQQCEGDSQCLVENEGKCIFNPPGLRYCAGSIDNEYYLKDCINSSYLCKNGSNQYAGYPECLWPPFSTGENYSASYIFQHPETQICQNPYAPFEPEADTPCIDIYPETSKCPASSNCPECPCGTANSENNVVVGQCSEFSYNDDPLTFYCEQNWWDNTAEKKLTPIGNERFCSKENEIPIGRAVDATEAWADGLIKQLEDVAKNISDMADYVKKIGDENPQSYCKCDSVCENGKPCFTDCQYANAKVMESGNEVENCICGFKPCAGISCQKMINLLKGGKTDNCPVEKDGIGKYYDKIKKGVKDFNDFIILQNRSDILKELTYSRTKTNECSLVKNANSEQAKILSCKRAEDEIIPPIGRAKTIINGKVIKAHCYGQNLENYGAPNLADNWFCCEKR